MKGVTGGTPAEAFLRGRVYELLAHALDEPSPEFLDFVKSGEFLSALAEAAPGADLGPAARAAGDCREAGPDAAAGWYEALVSPRLNLLYECRYHAPMSTFEEMADIAGFYRAFGLENSGERADHICLELEFMRLLALKEARALMDGLGEKAAVCVSAQRGFLASHLGRWARALSAAAEGVKFYGPILSFLDGWVRSECRRLSAAPVEVFYSLSEPSPPEEASWGCFKEAIKS